MTSALELMSPTNLNKTSMNYTESCILTMTMYRTGDLDPFSIDLRMVNTSNSSDYFDLNSFSISSGSPEPNTRNQTIGPLNSTTAGKTFKVMWWWRNNNTSQTPGLYYLDTGLRLTINPLSQPMGDIVIDSVTINPSNIIIGQTSLINITVRNRADNDTFDFFPYLTRITPSGLKYLTPTTRNNISIAGGNTANLNFSVTANTGDEGNWDLTLDWDSDGGASDTEITTYRLIIGGIPDISLVSSSFNPTQINIGQQTIISARVKNTGGASGVFSIFPQIKNNGNTIDISPVWRPTINSGEEQSYNWSFTPTAGQGANYSLQIYTLNHSTSQNKTLITDDILSVNSTTPTNPNPAISITSPTEPFIGKKGEVIIFSGTIINNGTTGIVWWQAKNGSAVLKQESYSMTAGEQKSIAFDFTMLKDRDVIIIEAGYGSVYGQNFTFSKDLLLSSGEGKSFLIPALIIAGAGLGGLLYFLVRRKKKK